MDIFRKALKFLAASLALFRKDSGVFSDKGKKLNELKKPFIVCMAFCLRHYLLTRVPSNLT